MNINLGLSADATGTVDVITATYSPAPTLVDKKILWLKSAGPNLTTTPTFEPNAVGANVIKARGGVALRVGDTGAAGYDMILKYHDTGTYWELLNPATVSKTDVGLSNVDNTSDVNKPVSTAQAAADAATLASANSYADSKVIDSIADSDTTHAPSRNAVFDALALKEDLSNKSTDVLADKASDAKYSSAKSVYEYSKKRMPFYISATISHTGTITETLLATSSNLFGLIEAHDYFRFEVFVSATATASLKTLRWYISDSPSSLVNQVLVGAHGAGTGWGTNLAVILSRFLKMKLNLAGNIYLDNSTISLNQNNFYAQSASPMNSAGAIDFSVGPKYLVLTGQLALATDTISILEGHSLISKALT